MARSVTILQETLLSQKRFRLTRTKAEIEEADGTRRIVEHEIYHYGRAAAVLLYDPVRGLVRLVKQFRLAAYFDDGALDTIEACAGMLAGDEPEACVIREAFEETGVRVPHATHVFDAYMSPGGVTETIACFVAPYSAEDCVGEGGGVDADEHIEIIEIPFDQALTMIESGSIRDAKTIALLYYAKAKGCFDAPA
ncbi:MAG TPA: NUDIX domain-containing protein [Roseiarcus sp.]|jgi:nudix-type nucleoside diphosphatase (YffH/AdpP family)